MARTALTPADVPGTRPQVAGWLTFTAADASNGNAAALGAQSLMVYARNSGGSAQTLEVLSVADAYGRTDDVVFTIPAGDILELGPYGSAGFAQADGALWLDASSADVLLSVRRLLA
jgi:hypothetical protein